MIPKTGIRSSGSCSIAFSNEADAGSRQKNDQTKKPLILIQKEPNEF
jgi:hypothetical protein